MVTFLKRAHLRCLLWLYSNRLSFSIWHSISRFLNFIWGLFVKPTEVPTFPSLEDLNIFLKSLSWKEDKIHFLNIGISHNWMKDPRLIQTKLNDKEAVQTDCDEFALYAEAALDKINVLSIMDPRVLTVRGFDKKRKVRGHNVAIFSYLPTSEKQVSMRKYAHIGNWGLFKDFSSIAEIAKDIAKQMDGVPIAYCITDKLRLKEHRVFRDQIRSIMEETFSDRRD